MLAVGVVVIMIMARVVVVVGQVPVLWMGSLPMVFLVLRGRLVAHDETQQVELAACRIG